MKNTILKIFTLSLLFFSFIPDNMIAQQLPKTPAPGDYLQQPTFSLLEGKWRATRDNEELTIVFKVQKKRTMGSFSVDVLLGWHEYKIDGQVNSSTLTFVNDFKQASIIAFMLEETDIRNKRVIMSTHDANKKNGSATGSIRLSNNNSLLFSIDRITHGEQLGLAFEGQPTKPRPTEESKFIKVGTWTLHKIN